MGILDTAIFFGELFGLLFAAGIAIIAVGDRGKEIWGVRVTPRGLRLAIGISALVAMVSFVGRYQKDRHDTEIERATEMEMLAGVDQTLKVTAENLKTTEQSLNVATVALDGIEKSLQLERETFAGVSESLNQVIRISNPINRIELSMTLLLPVDDPLFDEQRVVLDRALSRSRKGSNLVWCTSWNWGLGGTGTSGRDVLRPDDPMFPGNGGVADVFAIERLELVFYKRPIPAEEFFWPIDTGAYFTTAVIPDRPEPDLAVVALFSSADKWCLIRPKRRNERTSIYLELTNWTVPEERWERDTIDIQYLRDLTEVQLFLNIGGQGKSPAIRQRIDIRTIELRINGQPVAVSPNSFRKHVNKNEWQEGQPFWEYRFPEEFSKVFRSAEEKSVKATFSLGGQIPQ